jgi:hypothetical protein
MRRNPNAWTACPEDFRWLRLPWRVEPPKDVFNPSVLNLCGSPGRRILSNAAPANGLSASTCCRPGHAECNAPPQGALRAHGLLLRHLSFAPPAFTTSHLSLLTDEH